MTRKTKLMKWLIIFIFSMFILFTALSWVMYLGVWNSSTQTWDNLTWVDTQTWINLTWDTLTWDIMTWEINSWNTN
jgi:hypothetical protein